MNESENERCDICGKEVNDTNRVCAQCMHEATVRRDALKLALYDVETLIHACLIIATGSGKIDITHRLLQLAYMKIQSAGLNAREDEDI